MTMYAVMSTITSTIWKFVDLPVKPKSEALENGTLFSIQIKKNHSLYSKSYDMAKISFPVEVHFNKWNLSTAILSLPRNFAKDCENFDFSTILIWKKTFPKYFVIEYNLIYRNNLLRFFSFSWLFWKKPLL